jgi:hypothetical protein
MIYLPKEWVDRFTREHPWIARLLLVWFVALWIFIGWVVVDDWRHGR